MLINAVNYVLLDTRFNFIFFKHFILRHLYTLVVYALSSINIISKILFRMLSHGDDKMYKQHFYKESSGCALDINGLQTNTEH